MKLLYKKEKFCFKIEQQIFTPTLPIVILLKQK